MKNILFIFLILFSTVALANKIEVIDLHESKSLDQMVLDKIDNDTLEAENNDDNSNLNSTEEIENNNIDDNNSIDINTVEVTEDDWDVYDSEYIKKILDASKNIKSKSLYNEFSNFLINLNLDYNEKNNRKIFFEIINFFYETGEFSKAYTYLKTRNIENDENKNFYDYLEINYLLSTFQLEKVCSFIEQINNEVNAKK